MSHRRPHTNPLNGYLKNFINSKSMQMTATTNNNIHPFATPKIIEQFILKSVEKAKLFCIIRWCSFLLLEYLFILKLLPTFGSLNCG